MKHLLKNFLIFLIIFLIISGIFSLIKLPKDEIKEVDLATLVQEIQEEKVKKITIEEDRLDILMVDKKRQFAFKEEGESFSQLLANYGVSPEKLSPEKVSIVVKSTRGRSVWLTVVVPFLIPLLLLIGLIYFFSRQIRGAGTQAFRFGESRAKEVKPKDKKVKVTFKDVAGVKEAKEGLREIIEFLRNPKKFIALGAKIPKGVLLVGAPGTGKTLLARAVAGEASVPFFHISGSEFVEMFVGVGASVTGDTPILIRTKDETKLLPIGEFIDQFYKEGGEGLKKVEDIQTLGADWSRGTKFFKSSSWKKVRSVYRHKVNKIYEIQFVGGKIKVTGDHSVFIRNKNHIICKKVSDLKIGDVLISLPYSARGKYSSELSLGSRTPHYAKAHKFPESLPFEEITVWSSENDNNNNPERSSYPLIPGSIAKIMNLSKGQAVGLRTLTAAQLENLVYKVKITPGLMRLMGYYTAEGLYHKQSHDLRFCFGSHEEKFHKDCIKLMEAVFSLKGPKFFNNNTTDRSALVIYYNSTPIARFFAKHCGSGAHNKHIPEFLWDSPKEYFVSYLDGLVKGDGYINKRGMIEFSSCSKQLISELRWLLNMHGIPCSVTKYKKPAGHRIKNGKPLLESTYWRITVATLVNPLLENSSPKFLKRPIIKKIVTKLYKGYVYDLCGCENEAFFGGEKPVLLHNSRVRDLFKKAKKNLPAILFIDELDAVGRLRGAGLGGGHDEREQTLNQILVELDGFEPNIGLAVLAATNRPDVLDPALLRPGRFDRKVILDMPDIKDRQDILEIHANGKPLAANVSLKKVAQRTPGFSGADLANLMNEAAILAAKRDKKNIGQQEILESIERVMLGPERKSHILEEREKKIVAFHEAGHALVSYFLPHCDPVQKVSIIARGQAAGYTLKMPEKEKYLRSKSEFLDNLSALLGGYASEKIFFGEVTTGAANDLQEATKVALQLVTEYGMSETLGPRTFGEQEEMIFLGREISSRKDYSEKTARIIDEEVSKIIDSCYNKAKEIISANKKNLKKVATLLLKKETLEKEEFQKAVNSFNE